MNDKKIEFHMGKILPREGDDSPVMNVSISFSVPEDERRSNLVDIGVFVPKSTATIQEIRSVALAKALETLKKIIAHHS